MAILNAKTIGLVIFLALVVPTTAVSQEGSASDPRRPLQPEKQIGVSERDLPFFSPERPPGCELMRLYLDDAAERARRIPGSSVIAIGRLGTGEQSASVNARRLEEVKRFLEQLASVSTVTAQGERSRGYGLVEIYVGGKRLYRLPYPRNRVVRLGSCEF